jgi:hypothetical protein
VRWGGWREGKGREGKGRGRWRRRGSLPSSFAGTVLLGLLGVGIDVAGLGKVAREVLGGHSSTVSEASVVAIVVLVRLAHCGVAGQHV